MHNLYVANELFPGRKGAQAHIARSIEAITRYARSVDLACLGTPDMPAWQDESPVTIHRCRALHPNFLKRSLLFDGYLRQQVPAMRVPDVVQFRDIWSGVPLLDLFRGRARTVFEVNGLPSAELPVHFPGIVRNDGILHRLRTIEERCLRDADRIVTVSDVTARWLSGRGADPAKISVIRNAAPAPSADLPRIDAVERFAGDGKPVILYAGTLTPWQGVDVLLDGFVHIADALPEARLVIASSVRRYRAALLQRIAALRLRKRILLLHGLDQPRMQALYRRASVSVAPLVSCARNEVQGCCPVKIVESMAAGCPVVASDLAVCRELVTHGVDGWLVAPGSTRALADGVLGVLGDASLSARLSAAARERARRAYSIEAMTTALRQVHTG